MRVLFSVNNFGFLRNFEPALRQLAARGHDLHLLAERKDSVGGTRTIDNLVAAHPDRITFSYAPARKERLLAGARHTGAPVPGLLALPRCAVRRVAEPSRPRGARRRRRLPRAIAACCRSLARVSRCAPGTGCSARFERTMPPGETATRRPRPSIGPICCSMTPLLYFGSQQVEYVRAARPPGFRCVLGVGSWDHLTTKGSIHERPHRMRRLERSSARRSGRLHGIARRWSASRVRRPTTTGSCSGRRTTREDVLRESRRPARSAAAPVSLLVAVHHSATKSASCALDRGRARAPDPRAAPAPAF